MSSQKNVPNARIELGTILKAKSNFTPFMYIPFRGI